MPSLFQMLKAHIRGNTHSAHITHTPQERTDTLTSVMVCEFADMKEIDLMISFDYRNKEDNDSILMSVNLNVTHIDEVQNINMYTEFKPQDLVSPELLSVLNTIANSFVTQYSNEEYEEYEEYNLLTEVAELTVSHTFRGHKQSDVTVYKAAQSLIDKIHAECAYNEHTEEHTKRLCVLDILQQKEHCINIVLYPHITGYHGILQFSSVMADASYYMHAFNRDSTVYEIVSIHDTYKHHNNTKDTFNITETVHYDIKNYVTFICVLSNIFVHISQSLLSQ